MPAHADEMKTIHSIGGRHHLTYFFGKWFYSATMSLGSESSLGLRRSITFISGHSKSICYILLLEVNSLSSQGWPKTSISVFPQISNLLSAMTLAWEKLIYYHIDSRYFLKWKIALLEEKICSSPRHYSLKISIFLQNLRLSYRKKFGQDAKFCLSTDCWVPLMHDQRVCEKICFSPQPGSRVSHSCPQEMWILFSVWSHQDTHWTCPLSPTLNPTYWLRGCKDKWLKSSPSKKSALDQLYQTSITRPAGYG